MRRRPALLVFVLALTLLAVAGCGKRQPPSIVVIMVDDLGAFDLASYGHPFHRTPNIDRLAQEGLRFTRAYAAAPLCAPTRAAFLTGKSPARLHLTHSLPPQPVPLLPRPASTSGPVTQQVTEPQSATWLAPAETTIAERLRARGYRTALIGKWHLGRGESGPANQGFDVAIGGEEEAAPLSHFSPYGLSRLDNGKPGEYLTDRLTDEAEAFLEASAEQPFFLVLSHFAVHTPIEAGAERLGEWRQRLRDGEGAPGSAAAADSLAPAYAAMMESVDQSVGRVMAKLEALGLARDTLVVVTSDNGALVETPDTGEAIGTNGPLRGGKGMLYEGGLRVPLIVRWPAVVEVATETEFPTGTADWFPTLVEIAGTGDDPDEDRSSDGSSSDGGALDGESLVPVLRGAHPRADRSLHFLYPHYVPGYRHDPARETHWNTPGAAIRSGAMKLIHRFDGADELYDLASDPGETHDLATERPDEAARLGDDLRRWLESEDAYLPQPNLAYDAGAFARGVENSLAALGSSSEWTPNGECSVAVRNGRLALDCADTPFILGPEMIARGPLRVAVRFDTAGTRGAPALWYRAVTKPQFSGDRVALVPGAKPGVREGRIPLDDTIRQLRVDFGRAKGGRAQVDWIRLYRDGEDGAPVVEWSFDVDDVGRERLVEREEPPID